MTQFQQKLAALLELAQQYQELSTANSTHTEKLKSIQDLITALKKEQQTWTKKDPSDWLEVFEEVYTKYDQACCAEKLTAKEERLLKKAM